MADRMRSSLQLVIALLLITASVVVVDVAFAHQTPSSGEFFFYFSFPIICAGYFQFLFCFLFEKC